MAPPHQKLRILKPRSGESKHVGTEPSWENVDSIEDSDRRVQLALALNWYNYNHDIKEARQCLVEWLEAEGRKDDARSVKNGTNVSFKLVAGWLARMSAKGFQLNESETSTIESVVSAAVAEKAESNAGDGDAEKKFNIQDRLNEVALEAGGEIEGMFDDMILNGVKMTKKHNPIDVLQKFNVVPQKISLISDHWQSVLEEFHTVQGGDDEDLIEGYSNFGKIDIRNMIKFAEQVISDCNSYAQMKKLSRSPRKTKPISPEKRVAKFKYLKEFAELGLKSVSPTKLVDAKEAWLYDTKKRKLIHVVPDPLIKTFTVKGSTIIGFDPTATSQKTLRKPKEQIAEFNKCNAAKARTWFKSIKATEIKYNGRGNENLILLLVR